LHGLQGAVRRHDLEGWRMGGPVVGADFHWNRTRSRNLVLPE
jgi:hypothetical protein